MELLEKDTITLWTRARATIPIYVKYSFFCKKSYQDAVLGHIEYLNRIVQCSYWSVRRKEKTGLTVT
ncbi:hypothetical protein [Enterococcus mundtii]|uniref:hypothetical protein n=1 Tax=Enterococcus mundtii TaxID=53346 RepID=UPI0035BEFB14